MHTESSPEFSIVSSLKTEHSLEELNKRFPDNRLAEVIKSLEEEEFRALFDIQQELGVKVYLTGGILREGLIGYDSNDFDFVIRFAPKEGYKTENYIQEFESFFGEKEYHKGQGKFWVIRGKYGTLVLTGFGFGVYKFCPIDSNILIDISFPRRDFSPEVTLGGAKNILVQSDPTMSFKDDVFRRDFTINGLGLKLFQPETGKIETVLVDYIGGLNDLGDRTLRAIGDPNKRISESLNRIIRGVRFSQKGFKLHPTLEEAMKRAVAGDRHGFNYRAFQRRYADGRFVIPREIVAINFLKSFKENPAGTLNILNEIGALEDLFPDLVSYQPLKKLPKNINEEVSKKLSQPHLNENHKIRQEFFLHVLKAIELHHSLYPKATLDEYFFFLVISLGKSWETIKYQQGMRQFHHSSFRYLSQMYAERIVTDNALTSPSDPEYRIHPVRINGWIKNHVYAMGILSFDVTGEITGKLAQQLISLFPKFTEDPYWRILNTYVKVFPNVRKASSNILAVEKFLAEVEKSELKKPGLLKEILNGSDLINVFHLEPGKSFSVLLDSSEITYSDLALESNENLSLKEVKRRIFTFLLTRGEIRAYWRNLITEEDIDIFLGKDSPVEQREFAKRMFLRALERQAVLNYLSETLESVAKKESASFKQLKWSLTNLVSRRRNLTSLGLPGELGETLADGLLNDPLKVVNWISKSIENNKSIVSAIFPELVELNHCDQDEINHAEGNVWIHTALIFKKFFEMKIDLTSELAIGALYHDIGKPNVKSVEEERIRFIGHQDRGVEIFPDISYKLGLHFSDLNVTEIVRLIRYHDKYYRKSPTALQVRRDFPKGIKDNLYLMMLGDRAASYLSDGRVRNDNEILAPIQHFGTMVIMESEYHPNDFDKLVSDDYIQSILTKQRTNQKMNILYELFLEHMTPESILTKEELAVKFLQRDPNYARDYVKQTLFPGRMIIEKYGLQGKEIGQLQLWISNEIYNNGIQPNEEDINNFINKHTNH